jgi:hypothetical protein
VVENKLGSVRRRKIKTTTTTIGENLRTLYDILCLYGYKNHTGKEISSTIPHYQTLINSTDKKLPEEKKIMTVFKYKIAAFFSIWNNQTLPQKPFTGEDDPKILFSGSAGRFCTVFLKRVTKTKRMSFLTSINQSKTGMARVGEKILKMSEVQFQEDLSKEQIPFKEFVVRVVINERQSNLITITQNTLEREISRTVLEILGPTIQRYRSLSDQAKKEVDEEERVKAFFPSTSANYINNRDNAGSVGAILDNPMIQAMRVPGGFIGRKNNELQTQRYQTKKEESIENEDIDYYESTPNFKTKYNWYQIEEEIQEQEVINYNPVTENFQKGFSRLWHICKGIASREPNNAIPVSLAEPLKVRTITKGPPFKMFVLRFIQKKLHNILREHPTFKLVGSPTGGEENMAAYLQLILSKGRDKDYLSGDYKAATDNLKSWASNAAANSISAVLELDSIESQLFKESLTGYNIELGKKHKNSSSKKQTVGQLMGSITSFPILCIINAAISRYAYELGHNDIITLDNCPMAINGDDIVMKCGQRTRQIWKRILEAVGLKESIGKSFFSKNFLQINSRNFLIEGEVLTQVPYVNMGLLYGLKKSGQKKGLIDPFDPIKTIGSRYRDLMEDIPKDMKEEIHDMFIKHHGKILKSVRLPWYIPEWLGGIGLIGFKEPPELDLRVAQSILYNWKKKQPKPINKSSMLWKTWEIAKARIPKPFTVDIENRGVELYKKAIMLNVINTMFDSDINLEDIFEGEEKGNGKKGFSKAIRYNEELWRPKPGALPMPIKYEEILYKKKWLSYVDVDVVVLNNDLVNKKGGLLFELD